jgi:hypothetical protein
MFNVKYFDGETNITAGILAGTYQTAPLSPGATHLIVAQVKVKTSAAAGSKVKRLVTITSVGDPTHRDAVKFKGRRA